MIAICIGACTIGPAYGFNLPFKELLTTVLAKWQLNEERIRDDTPTTGRSAYEDAFSLYGF